MAARYKKFPDLKMAGMSGGPAIALFTSEHVRLNLNFECFHYDLLFDFLL